MTHEEIFNSDNYYEVWHRGEIFEFVHKEKYKFLYIIFDANDYVLLDDFKQISFLDIYYSYLFIDKKTNQRALFIHSSRLKKEF